jgi:Tfp pilus assembly protein PilZ
MSEKRSCTRTEVELRALIHEIPGEGYHARITNIGKGGLFLVTPMRLRIGTDVIVDIDAETIGSVIGIRGHIVRSTEGGMAVEFTHADEKSLEKLISVEGAMALKNQKPRAIYTKKLSLYNYSSVAS